MKSISGMGRQILNSLTNLRQVTRVPIPFTGVARDKWDPTLSNRPLSKKIYTNGRNGNIVRKVPKRPDSMSARQWKIQQKSHRRWMKNNKLWFGVKGSWQVGDKRIPVVEA